MAIEWNETRMQLAYAKAKSAKVGETIVCPTCGTHFVKTSYQQAFCRTRGKNGANKKANLCKDQYWNFINPRGEMGAKAILAKNREIYNFDECEGIHPFSEDGVQGGF